MPKFAVDVKAFINIEVEAPNAKAAIAAAEDFVRSCEPTTDFRIGWNDGAKIAGEPERIVEAGGFDIDGDSDVEEI